MESHEILIYKIIHTGGILVNREEQQNSVLFFVFILQREFNEEKLIFLDRITRWKVA